MANLFDVSSEEFKKNPPIRKISRGKQDYIVTESFVLNEKRISEFKVREDDYWVMGFQKTGTTWLQEMVWCIGNDLNFTKSKSIPVNKKFPLLELELLPRKERHEEWEVNSLSFIEKMDSPRFIKTHIPWQLLPTEIRTGKVKPKIIYIHRNPKDVVPSFYTFMNRMGRFDAPKEVLFEAILNDKIPPGPFWTHVNEFKRRKSLPNLLILSYEEMKMDIDSTIRKVTKFLNKSFTDEQIEAFKKHLSFDGMKENKSVSIRVVNGEEKDFLGKGLIGSYKEHMTPEMIARYDEWIEKNQEIPEEVSEYDVE